MKLAVACITLFVASTFALNGKCGNQENYTGSKYYPTVSIKTIFIPNIFTLVTMIKYQNAYLIKCACFQTTQFNFSSNENISFLKGKHSYSFKEKWPDHFC